MEINSARAKQTAAEKLFKVVSQHAKDVPLLIIATKKDEFEDMKAGERRRQAKKEGITISEEDIDSYAEHQLQERLCKITEEMHEIAGGRIDECVAVSQGQPPGSLKEGTVANFETEDKESISELTQKTADCFGTERVRLLYIRAQVTRVDLKIDLALAETMRVYRHILASSTTLAGVPIGSSTNKFSAAIHILRAILTCFGLPSVAPETVFAICKANLWDDLGNNMLVAIAEGLSIVSVLATVASLGTMPMIVIPMVVNIPVVVPATARMFLMLACDMIFVLTRAFTEASAKCIGQPLKQDVEKAVLDYRRWCRGVHGQVKDLIPNVNVIKAFRVGEVEVGVKKIIEEYKSKVVDGVGAPVAVFRNNTSASRNSYVRTSTPGPSSASTILVSEKGDDYGKASSFEQYTKPAKEIDVTDNDAVAELLKEKLDIVALADS